MCLSWKCPAHRVRADGHGTRAMGRGYYVSACTHSVQPISRELGRGPGYIFSPKGQVSSDASRRRRRRQRLARAAEVRRWACESHGTLALVGLGLGPGPREEESWPGRKAPQPSQARVPHRGRFTNRGRWTEGSRGQAAGVAGQAEGTRGPDEGVGVRRRELGVRLTELGSGGGSWSGLKELVVRPRELAVRA